MPEVREEPYSEQSVVWHRITRDWQRTGWPTLSSSGQLSSGSLKSPKQNTSMGLGKDNRCLSNLYPKNDTLL